MKLINMLSWWEVQEAMDVDEEFWICYKLGDPDQYL